MKRKIEELIEQRKKSRDRIKEILSDLGTDIEKCGLFRKKRDIRAKLDSLLDELGEWINVQDREWDARVNNHYTGIFDSLAWRLEKLETEYDNLKSLVGSFARLEQSLQDLIASAGNNAGGEQSPSLSDLGEQLSPAPYSMFEQRFRGRSTDVRAQLRRYIPWFSGVDDVFDLGCGRGEFLALLQKEGKRCRGVDTSLSMLEKAAASGLDCVQADILTFMRDQADESAGGVFSAQVIEHLKPELLRRLTIECFRVLKPGGRILLETINPLSLFALSRIFFLDVTHEKPLHPEYMRFLLETSGFRDVDILFSETVDQERLEEAAPSSPDARVFNSNVDKLNRLLYASPIYAVRGIRP